MYYRGISSAVQLGKQVPESILSGLSLFATASFGKYTKTEQLGLKQDAIDMLSY
jgi:non-canonical (house-cleaning) NTP pyrophosphatase